MLGQQGNAHQELTPILSFKYNSSSSSFTKQQGIMGSFADNWRNLSGDNLWDDLLEPLDSELRRYIIHYGERAGAIDDAFIGGKLIAAKQAKSLGLPRYEKANLFEDVGLVKGNPYSYDVKNYVYGTPKLAQRSSNLMAYVAVSTDSGSIALGRRDILIAWRGTQLDTEVSVDKVTKLRSAPFLQNASAMVHSGWFDYYTHVDARTSHNKKTSCRDQVLAAVKTLVNEYSEREDFELSITITGRGTGAAFAILNGMDIVINSLKPDNESLVTVIVFGAPRVGNEAFSALEVANDKLQILRVTNELDPTPKLVPAVEYYKSIGKELRINTINSPHLKNPKVTAGELEVYLYGVASQQGVNGAFTVSGIRDLLMVNKKLDGLKDEYKVVPKWILHKFMVQDQNGRWDMKDDPVDEE